MKRFLAVIGILMLAISAGDPIAPFPETLPPCADCRCGCQVTGECGCCDIDAAKRTTSCCATPTPKVVPEAAPEVKEPAALVMPLGDTNWGVMEGAGKDFIIEGHPQWDAVVQVRTRKDGSTWVWVLWTLKSNSEPCPGVYRVVDGQLHGTWGHGDRVQVDGDGQMTGQFSTDTIRQVKVQADGGL